MADRFPPGSAARGLLGSLPGLRHDRLGLLVNAVHDYGEIVHFRLVNRHVVLLANPADVRHVFQDNYRNYSKPTPGFRVLRAFLADGLLTNKATPGADSDGSLSRRSTAPGLRRSPKQ